MFAVFLLVLLNHHVNACTIVAVSGRVTADGRPLLLKNRDSSTWDIKINICQGNGYLYLAQSLASGAGVYSGYNERGFAIISSHSYNMPNSDYGWNAYIMQMALGRCATVDEFENMLDSLPKPISVCSNYGVMDSLGNVAIFEVSAYNFERFDADSTASGYLIRTNYSFSQDTAGIYQSSSPSYPRYQIATSYLANVVSSSGAITKEHLLGLSRHLVNGDGIDLRDLAPFDENDSTPVEFRYYVPRRTSTSAMVIQGILPNESPNHTVAWTMIGPPMTTVAVPYMLTTNHVLPQKAMRGADGHSWLCYKGRQLKNSCFVDNNTLNLAKLYNQSGTGVMQKTICIEEEILERGNGLVDSLRIGIADSGNITTYYSWVNSYLDQQYNQCVLNDSCQCGNDNETDTSLLVGDTIYVYVHDTIMMVDSVIIEHDIYDTITTVDTLWMTFHDTVWMTDTLWMPFYDTIWKTDTLYIHDTIYLTQIGIDYNNPKNVFIYQSNGGIIVKADENEMPRIVVYDVNGRLIDYSAACNDPERYFAVPSSGVYLVKVEDYPARRIVVIKK